ncbi:unnamed protein product, partial [Allacma fusca]
YDFGNRLDYEVIGETIFAKYPQIENPGGKSTPWGLFNTCLSNFTRQQRRGRGVKHSPSCSLAAEDFKSLKLVSCGRKQRQIDENQDFSGIAAKMSRMLHLISEEPENRGEMKRLLLETYGHRSNSVLGGVTPARIFSSYPMLALPSYVM